MVTTETDGTAGACLALDVEPARVAEFFPLLQRGVRVCARVGCTLAVLLGEEFGLVEAYVARRITTIFLDSRPIDDVHHATVREGSTIALSGAMPGLVGATMRCGGYYAAMRGAITHREESDAGAQGRGTVRIKLFNLLLPELGPALLGRGVLLTPTELSELFSETTQAFWEACRGARLDGVPVEMGSVRGGAMLSDFAAVRLCIDFRD